MVNILNYIKAKKSRFQGAIQARQEQKEVDRYKNIIRREQRVIKLEERETDRLRIAELAARERELRTPSMLRGFSLNSGSNPSSVKKNSDGKAPLKGVASSARAGIGRPTLFGNPNSSIGAGYTGPDLSNPSSASRDDLGDKNRPRKKGYEPFGYRGIQ